MTEYTKNDNGYVLTIKPGETKKIKTAGSYINADIFVEASSPLIPAIEKVVSHSMTLSTGVWYYTDTQLVIPCYITTSRTSVGGGNIYSGSNYSVTIPANTFFIITTWKMKSSVGSSSSTMGIAGRYLSKTTSSTFSNTRTAYSCDINSSFSFSGKLYELGV